LSNSSQRTLLILGSVAILLAGVALILSSLSTSAPQAQPATPTQQPAPTNAADIPEPDIVRVRPGAAKAAYDLKQAIFLDVRDKDSYANSHIPGAISIPLAELESRATELNPTDWIITYCT
jgi:3-mercaptopyruvate sulfurtransferase SseA